MIEEDKKLLLKDLCARLPHKAKVCLYEKETCISMGEFKPLGIAIIVLITIYIILLLK